jgi:ectoine hydroxylase-related dioxygenase (phytanoyl-CoA dioxygenase family)
VSTQIAPLRTPELEHQLDELERNGYVMIENAIEPELLGRVTAIVDRVQAEEQAAGRAAADGSIHTLEVIDRDRTLPDLMVNPRVFPLICSALGWNIHLYHSHIDVHPPLTEPPRPVWRWHQDGGRQNLEIETQPTRPKLSVKVAYFVSDASEADRGNMLVIPGSHLSNTLPRPEHPELGFEQPEGHVQVLAAPGTACVFDRRIWHGRSDNMSQVTRKGVFMGYTYRWMRPRHSHAPDAGYADLDPVQAQLLGASTTQLGHWIPKDEDVPLKAWMRENGLLDPTNPAHR